MFKQLFQVRNQVYRSVVKSYSQIAMTDISQTKKEMRQDIKTKLRNLSPQQMKIQSEQICSLVLNSSWWKNASRVGLYVHCERLKEVNTTTILQNELQQDMRVFIPRVDGQQSDMSFLHLDTMEALTPVAPFGILEPTETYMDGTKRLNVFDDNDVLQVLLMPGLGFDKKGRRLGRGGGYYDKFVSTYLELIQQREQQPPLLVGLCYDVQLQEEIPISDHDHPVNMVITPHQIHKIHD
eukprot:TRINITY_DN2181_c0_g1_i3.p2 TRINITY_DN2181_c0_g1~~TRINITY_DN2181_c0_g1_i3.p2  ORF type:complete len:238 (-),score=19.56 TRINITY_DN2181_c0_g1_i3:311-1024(-)